jgi:hypothetical protein
MSRSAEESEYARAAELAYQELLSRMGEGSPSPDSNPHVAWSNCSATCIGRIP